MPILSQTLTRRAMLGAAAWLAAPAMALAQTPIKFQLDWRFEGPAALFLASAAKGYYKAAGLDVTIDAGNGSGGTVTRVASGTYDMGFADLAALMEFHANNPDARAEGFGVVNHGRLALMASQVSDAFATKTRIDPAAVWTDAFLPGKAELNVLPPLKK